MEMSAELVALNEAENRIAGGQSPESSGQLASYKVEIDTTLSEASSTGSANDSEVRRCKTGAIKLLHVIRGRIGPS